MFARVAAPERKCAWNNLRMATKDGFSFHWAKKKPSFDVAENLGRDAAIADTPFTLKIDDYWADFRIENGKPTSVSDQPNNPAVLVTIRGKGVAASEPETNPHASPKDLTTTGGPPSMPAPGEGTPNHLTLFIADDGTISYELTSRKNGKSSGKIELDKPLPTGWADWQLTIDKTMPHAASSMDFNPVNSGESVSEHRFARWSARRHSANRAKS